jgi:hypothetical protein
MIWMKASAEVSEEKLILRKAFQDRHCLNIDVTKASERATRSRNSNKNSDNSLKS